MHPVHVTRGRVGLLGGSFNPAHQGHVHISQYALNRLGLDEVWWLVSPRNPLKSESSLADYDMRLRSARHAVRCNKRIRVLDIEKRLGTRYTYQVLDALKRQFPAVQFVWMMGADNLAQFHRWKRWRQVLAQVTVIVFDRAPHSHRSLRSPAAGRIARNRLKLNDIGGTFPLPGLLYVHLRRDPASSTALRKMLGAEAFLGHNALIGMHGAPY